MTALFLTALVIICALVLFMFIILKATVNKINSQTKQYFVDKVQEYDYMIDDKQEKLNDINKKIEETSIIQVENKNDNRNSSNDFDYKVIELLNKTEYQNKNIFEINREIDEKFNINYEELIKKFISNIKDNGSYEICLKLKNKFDASLIYNLKVMLPEEVEKYLKETLNETEYKLYKVYSKEYDGIFDVDSFINYLNELIDLNNPIISVYVGDKNLNYDHLSKYIKTIYSRSIYKGIKIIYKNKIYDYSLNEGNV